MGKGRALWGAMLLVAAASRVARSTPVPIVFPEEAERAQWDAGCSDWPTDWGYSPNSQASSAPKLRIEKAKGAFRLLATMTVRPEAGETPDQLRASVERALARGDGYRGWVMPGINEKEPDGRYFVDVEDLFSQQVTEGSHYILTGPYRFHLLWFERQGVSSLSFRTDRLSPPDCPLFQAKGKEALTRVFYRMTPRPEILDYLVAELFVVPRGREVDLKMRLVSKPSTLIYELMPESLLASELYARGHRILENFRDARSAALTSEAAETRAARSAAPKVRTPASAAGAPPPVRGKDSASKAPGNSASGR